MVYFLLSPDAAFSAVAICACLRLLVAIACFRSGKMHKLPAKQRQSGDTGPASLCRGCPRPSGSAFRRERIVPVWRCGLLSYPRNISGSCMYMHFAFFHPVGVLAFSTFCQLDFSPRNKAQRYIGSG